MNKKMIFCMLLLFASIPSYSQSQNRSPEKYRAGKVKDVRVELGTLWDTSQLLDIGLMIDSSKIREENLILSPYPHALTPGILFSCMHLRVYDEETNERHYLYSKQILQTIYEHPYGLDNDKYVSIYGKSLVTVVDKHQVCPVWDKMFPGAFDDFYHSKKQEREEGCKKME